MCGRGKRTLVGESCDLLRDYRVFLHAGARSAHTFQRCFGDHLVKQIVCLNDKSEKRGKKEEKLVLIIYVILTA